MKLRSILRGAASVAGTLNPAVGAAIGLVNQFLPSDKKLPLEATGAEVEDAMVANLTPDQRASLYERNVDLVIAQEEGWTARYEAMCRSDGQSTRAWIAKQMARVLVFEILAFTVWAFWYPDQLANPVLWTVFGTLTGVPGTILLNYFGNLRKEQGQRASAVSGIPQIGAVAGLLKSLKS